MNKPSETLDRVDPTGGGAGSAGAAATISPKKKKKQEDAEVSTTKLSPPANKTGVVQQCSAAAGSLQPGYNEAAKVASSLGLQGPAAPIGAQLLLQQVAAAAAAAAASNAGGSSSSGSSSSEVDLLQHTGNNHVSPTTTPASTVYHANLLAGTSGSVQAALLQQPLSSLSPAQVASMQASAPSSSSTGNTPATSEATSAFDLQTMQSMEWLFKKERIYLLAQFWQQVSPLNHFKSP